MARVPQAAGRLAPVNRMALGARASVRTRTPDFSPSKIAGLLLALALGACAPKLSAQCGVASLANVLARAGQPVGYADLLRKTRVEADHTTFVDLAQTARDCGVRMKGYRLSNPDELKPNDLGILELAADHFVALVGHQGGAYRIVDSTDGEIHEPDAWSAARLEAEWTGNVLLVERLEHGLQPAFGPRTLVR